MGRLGPGFTGQTRGWGPALRARRGAGARGRNPDLHGAAVAVVPLEVRDGGDGDRLTLGVPGGLGPAGLGPAGLRPAGLRPAGGVVGQAGRLRLSSVNRAGPDENSAADAGEG